MVSMTGISTKDSSSKKLKLAISFKGTVDDRKVVFELYQKPTNFDGTIKLFLNKIILYNINSIITI